MSRTVTVAHTALRTLVADLFVSVGVSLKNSRLVADSLVDSDLAGHQSHGVMRAVDYLRAIRDGEIRPDAELQVLSRTPAAVVCDAGFGFGQVQMSRLIDLLVPLAQTHGIACGTVRRSGHVGRLGEWVERIARRGLCGLMSVNDNGVLRCVAPPGGSQPCISTNPIAVGVPTGAEPYVLDISTSVVANGKIRVAQAAGQDCPDGWLLNAEGQPTNDPSTRFHDPPGTIRPMGGYKGFGLGMVFDILVGGLSGGFCPPAPEGEFECNNVLMLIFSPERFSGMPHFLNQSGGLCDFVRNSRTTVPGIPIRLPGDQSRASAEAQRRGGVPLGAATWDRLIDCARDLKVTIPALA